MIPFDALDKFYFDDFIANLHPELKPLAVDRHILRHEVDAEPLVTIKDLYQQQYLYIPYLIVEHFPLDDARLQVLGQAWVLRVIEFVVTDNVIDGQAPDNPLLVLFHQQVRTTYERLLHGLMNDHPDFWTHYHTTNHALANANALEIHCVDQHRQPYTLAIMEDVYQARSAVFSIVIQAMGMLTDQHDQIEPFLAYYQKVAISDQLLDDAADWRDDFREGRYTLPIVNALNATGIAYENAHTLSERDYDHLIKEHQILQQITQIALDHYRDIQQLFADIALADSTLAQFLERRIDVAEHALRRYDGIGLLQVFRSALTQ